ncbi:MAG: hypothetical protein IJ205_01415 [Bacteroidales bacterium]|nr:hypothetical protein [Bacteroidales bacterium]
MKRMTIIKQLILLFASAAAFPTTVFSQSSMFGRLQSSGLLGPVEIVIEY